MNKVLGAIQILDGTWPLLSNWFAEKSKGYWGEIQIDALYLK
ncbi:hypothetical protein QFZ31_002246 [Neobacillus niacini]|jgi:hypothetical protein|nr:hypothetical protein [Neobacillus niacini]